MRSIVLRPIILAASVLSVACSDQASKMPTSPTSMPLAPTETQRNATRLPLRGSFTAADRSTFAPPNLLLQGMARETRPTSAGSPLRSRTS